MADIKLIRRTHKDKSCIFIEHSHNQQLFDVIKEIPGRKFSATYKCWYLIEDKKTVNFLFNELKKFGQIDYSALKNKQQEEPKKEEKVKVSTKDITEDKLNKISEFRFYLKSKRYSINTINTYCDALCIFLAYFNDKAINEISENDIITFNNEYIIKNKLSESYQNQVVNAVKLFALVINGIKINPELIHRPRREKKLPNILSKEEIKQILNVPKNLKHKAMLSLIYACGLRCGELLRLLPSNIDSDRNLLIVKQAKGKKDRVVPLSNKTIELLRDYFVAYKPKTYLFEGMKPGTMYDERSLQQVLKQQVKRARINKPISLHWLRHSYATHLLESGTDIRYIQEILGHNSSRTTEIYTHVSTRNIQQITSPFDSL